MSIAPAVTEPVTDPDTGSRYYPHPLTGEQLTSVTSYLSDTTSKPFIPPWAAKLAAEYAVDQLAELAELVKTQGREAAVDLVKDQARLLRERKADAGSYVHAVAEALTLWAASPDGTGGDIMLPSLPDHLVDVDYDGEPLSRVVDWMIEGFTNFVAAFDLEWVAAEMKVYNRDLGVAGTLDMVIILRGVAVSPSGRLIPAPGNVLTLCVDIKTGKNLDVTAREQIAAYRRMKEALLPLGQVVPMFATDAGAILHLRPEFHEGFRLMVISPARDARAWNVFRRVVEISEGRAEAKGKIGPVVYPLNADGTMPAPRLCDLDGEGYGRTLRPLMKAGLMDVAEVSLWSTHELRAINGIGPKSIPVIRQMLNDHGLTLADEAELAGKVA